MIKKLALVFASTFALVACGDDSSSDSFSMEESFEMVLGKGAYSYNSKDSTLKMIYPVCKEGTLGNLLGPDEAEVWDTVTYRASMNKGIVTLKGDEDTLKFAYDGSSFPVGLWTDYENDYPKFQEGSRLEKKDVFSHVIRYDGSCLMKDYLSSFLKGNPALDNMDKTLASFYKQFFVNGATVDEETMIKDIRAVDCDELSLFDGLVKLKVDDFNASSGKIKVSFSDRTCDVSFKLRYAYEQEDCQAAFEDFKNDKHSEEEFDFDDYSFDIVRGGDNDDYCLSHLILELMEEKGLPTWTMVQTSSFARGLVKIAVGGLK